MVVFFCLITGKIEIPFCDFFHEVGGRRLARTQAEHGSIINPITGEEAGFTVGTGPGPEVEGYCLGMSCIYHIIYIYVYVYICISNFGYRSGCIYIYIYIYIYVYIY